MKFRLFGKKAKGERVRTRYRVQIDAPGRTDVVRVGPSLGLINNICTCYGADCFSNAAHIAAALNAYPERS
jgi:hypothetical protein